MAFDLEQMVHILSHHDFLSMKGLANEVPLFIRTYDPAKESTARHLVDSLASRLRSKGLTVKLLDLFDLVLQELEEHQLLDSLIKDETDFEKFELFETLQNYSDPKTHLIPRLVEAMGDGH